MVFTKGRREINAGTADPQGVSLRRTGWSAIVAASMQVRIRDLRVEDRVPLERLLGKVAVFEPHEIRVAMELVASALGTAGFTSFTGVGFCVTMRVSTETRSPAKGDLPVRSS